MLNPARSRPELKALTSLRGIAAMAVVLQHYSATAQNNAAGWIPSLVPHGYMAVDFFFVLSGFIMCYTYLAGFDALGMRAYGPFLWKRVARIFPLGLAVTAVILLFGGLLWFSGLTWLFLTIKGEGGIWAVILINAAHLQGFLPDYSLNDPSWSVSVELGAYLLFPLLIHLVFRSAPWVTAAFMALGTATLLYISRLDPAGGLAFRWPPLDLARCVVEFSFGMLVYRAFASRSRLHVLGQDRWTAAVVLCFGAGLAGRSDLLMAATFPALVLAFALNRERAGRMLSGRWVHWLGVISFSIYLVHNMFRVPLFWLIRQVHPDPLPLSLALGGAVAGSLLVLPIAALAYRTVERPGRDALNSLVRRISLRPLRTGTTRPAD